MSMPRAEYPRPSFRREDWLCLNGRWEFEQDCGDSGLERGVLGRKLSGEILVPFCPESALSGVGNQDFMNAVWYRREVTIPGEWAGKEVLLHFQACDYDTTVWVETRREGKVHCTEVARHRGGWTGFTAMLRDVAGPGETVAIIVRARDDARKPMPMGKQSRGYHPGGCHYPRTTGIWQTVWMEPVSGVSLGRPRVTPEVEGRKFRLELALRSLGRRVAGFRVRAVLRVGKEVLSRAEGRADQSMATTLELPVPEGKVTLWEPGRPFLYDIDLELVDGGGAVVDRATTYGGLRSVAVDGQRVLINGKSMFQRLVLDQGYYPDGILTAPSDEALVRDIELSMAAGFNGARLHQKVFEERFLFHADRLGYLCWGEFGDWGMDKENPDPTLVTQWLEALHRDYSHPSIIGWCGINESWQDLTDRIVPLTDLTQAFYLAAKAIDGTRPVLDASGYSHRVAETDIYDCHDYDQKPDTVRQRHAGTAGGKVFQNGGWEPHMGKNWSLPYRGQPFFVSEFGGTWWNPDAKEGDPSWGYGDRPKTVEEFYARFDGLCAALLENVGMFGYCYTQLTDVYQEQNGLYHFDRRAKFDVNRLRASQQRRAAIEE